jgi:replication factor C small subunit
MKKFTESKKINDYEVLTDTGWCDIKTSHKTIEYSVWEVKTTCGLTLNGADNHILFDEHYNEVYIKDLSIGDTILTKNGIATLSSIKNLGYLEEMYDLELPDTTNHRYYTNDFLSHNTSAAKALVKHFKHPYLYINASTDTSVDVVRNRITDFCANRSIMDEPGKLKVIILDEIDGVSDQFFKALRATMDQFASNARFVATCNYINKVPDPIQSRFEMIDFDFTKEEEAEIMKGYIIRILQICKEEGIGIDKHAAVELVKRKFPDLRNMLNQLQGFKSQGIEMITVNDIKKFSSVYKDIFDLVIDNTDPVKNYQYMLSNYSNRVDDVLSSLGVEFIQYIQQERPSYISFIPQVVVTVSKYQSQRQQVIDPAISMLACIYEVQSILNGA